MNIAICDDEKEWRDTLAELLKKYMIDRHIDMFTTFFDSGTDLTESEKNFDIIFMDFQMDGLNGIETARKINALKSGGIIIFVSAYTYVALDTFEVRAYRFLAKPIDKEKLFKAIDDYRKEIEQDDFLVFYQRGGTIRIKASEIIYVEGIGHCSKIHTCRGDHEIFLNIKAIQGKLPRERFFRCHKAFITSFLHIKAHDNIIITYDDDSTVFISRRFLPQFRKSFEEYILKHNTGAVE